VGLTVADARQSMTFHPGETHVMRATLGGIAQSGPTRVSVVVTPPSSIDGVAQKPIHRETWILLLPWMMAGGVALVGCGWQLVRFLRLRMLRVGA
jgi:hypothetical protein